MASSRVPHLSDLVLLWLSEKIGTGHRIEYGGGGPRFLVGTLRGLLDNKGDYSLRVDGIIIGWIYDDSFEFCGDVVGRKVPAANPDFFPQIWKHMENISGSFDPLYQPSLITYLKGKSDDNSEAV